MSVLLLAAIHSGRECYNGADKEVYGCDNCCSE